MSLLEEEPASKVCKVCGERKPLSDFHRKKHGLQGRNAKCACCVNSARRDWYTANLDARRKNKREWLAANRHKGRAYSLKYNHGITIDEYEALLSSQGYVCAICGTHSPGGTGSFHVDHDHSCCPGKGSCGKCIRGLLCNLCNKSMGGFGDDPDRLDRAADYLRNRGRSRREHY